MALLRLLKDGIVSVLHLCLILSLEELTHLEFVVEEQSGGGGRVGKRPELWGDICYDGFKTVSSALLFTFPFENRRSKHLEYTVVPPTSAPISVASERISLKREKGLNLRLTSKSTPRKKESTFKQIWKISPLHVANKNSTKGIGAE
ncbi:hypothetical protein Trydic_g9285 [Trypoxylus dichotomus]